MGVLGFPDEQMLFSRRIHGNDAPSAKAVASAFFVRRGIDQEPAAVVGGDSHDAVTMQSFDGFDGQSARVDPAGTHGKCVPSGHPAITFDPAESRHAALSCDLLPNGDFGQDLSFLRDQEKPPALMFNRPVETNVSTIIDIKVEESPNDRRDCLGFG